MKKKKMNKKGATIALALGLMIPAVTPAAAAGTNDITVESVKFNGMKVPSTIDQMVKTYTGATVEVKYSDGRVKKFPLSYKTLFKSEDKVATNKGEKIPAGTPIDVNGNPIMDNSVEGKPTYFVSDAPDSNSLLNPINGQLYMVTHYEYDTIDAAGKSAYGLVPASMSLTKLSQNKKNGQLKTEEVKKIDFSEVNGLWIPCNGSVSPWNTHLGSEEYEPDARSFEFNPESSARTWTESFAQLYFGDKSKANPYNYGYIPEITVNSDGSTKVAKHYSAGRFSHEVMKIMPDKRTAFFGDDGSYTMMFMYVADKAGDLSAGTLYAAKFHQTGTENGGSGNFEWIKLGHASDQEIRDIIDSGIKFSDIFETSEEPKEGFTAVKQYSYGKTEYLKLKPGMEKAAAFLESRRYGAMLGATSEFNKMEGITVNEKDKKVYVAISDLSGGMEKDTAGKDPVDDIQLPKIKSGVTFEMDLKAGQKDKDGNAIDSEYVAAGISGLIAGEDLAAPDAYGNTANVDKVANTDNLSYSEEMRTLFIGEDSGKHTNNFVWAYNVDTKELTRILSVPAGAESTGLLAVDDRNGFPYIMSNFQHPGDELDKSNITAVNKEELAKAMEEEIGIVRTGGVGYISGIPSLTNAPKPYQFKDVDKNHWAYQYVSDLQLSGMVKGTTPETFNPNQKVTRAQFTSMVVRALGLEAKGQSPFKDVSAPETAAEITAAYEAGIIKGESANKFAPNKPVTRQQMAKILMKAYEVKTGETVAPSQKTVFKDVADIYKDFVPYVNAAYEKGFIKGYEDGTFAPTNSLTRAQAAKVVYMLLNN
ncbi:S-layer homology domain-containing protein [Bacillus songklensis]|uniref:S-layer homology domain-containing protein n=1 Tax=Bacillus songklensis TaxID=1069116 RepID=A0ABV8B756_9BACI